MLPGPAGRCPVALPHTTSAGLRASAPSRHLVHCVTRPAQPAFLSLPLTHYSELPGPPRGLSTPSVAKSPTLRAWGGGQAGQSPQAPGAVVSALPARLTAHTLGGEQPSHLGFAIWLKRLLNVHLQSFTSQKGPSPVPPAPQASLPTPAGAPVRALTQCLPSAPLAGQGQTTVAWRLGAVCQAPAAQ